MQKLELTERTDEQMTDPCIGSVISRFASRGLAETARTEAEKQIEREERIRRDAPIAYRMSGSADGADAYRENGVMTEEGLLRYAGENRAMRVEGKDFVGDAVGIYAVAEAHALEPAVKKPTAMDTVRQAGEALKKRSPLWFDPRKGTTENEKRRFPLSAFAAVAAVAISMMLIVAGSLMVIGAETQISRLNREISGLHEEIADLKSDLESKVDLVEIRRIATEEYGMVSEEYLKMDYIELERDEIAEVAGGKRKDGIGLAGLLSAIGMK